MSNSENLLNEIIDMIENLLCNEILLVLDSNYEIRENLAVNKLVRKLLLEKSFSP